MRLKYALLVLLVLLICISPVGAALVTFTGNVDNDFNGKPGLISRPDTVADAQSGLSGCSDQPLGPNAFNFPQPTQQQISPSGFNIERVVTLYDCTTDTLYIGLDVCDGKIAWDADGNGDITTKDPDIVPGFTLASVFADDGLEDYEVEISVDGVPNPDMRILVQSEDGGVTVTTSSPLKPAVVTVDNAVTGADVELAVHNLRLAFPPGSPGQATLPINITTRSGATGDLVDEDVTLASFDLPCTTSIAITKGVSCSSTGPFNPTVQALRGATVYFQINVTNTGTDNLENVVITDSFATNGACCPGGSCIPLTINVGNLAAGQTKTYTYPVPTNSAFSTTGVTADCTNTASVTGVGVLTDISVHAGPVSAAVDVLVPSITCSKLLDNDNNFSDDAGDTTPPTSNLNLFGGGQAWYQFCVTNTGESPVDFTAGADPNCPSFNDSFLEMVDAQIPGTGVNLDNLFRTALQAQFGSYSLSAGQKVCVVVGPVTFNEAVLCPFRHEFPDTFTACGRATGTDICLPPSGGENVSTGSCTGKVNICPPCIRVTKEVSCSPTSGFGPSVQALRGATVYFKITVTNCGGEDLNDVTLTDSKSDVNNALLACTGCTNGLNCIPGTTNIGTLSVGQSKSFVCTVPTNPAFAVKGIVPDATNTVTVTATSAVTHTAVNAGPASATVDLLVPSITCDKQVDDNANFTHPTAHLNLSDLVMDVEQAWYKFCVTNTGETPVSFAAVNGQNCPGFSDTFLKAGGYSSQTCAGTTITIPGTDVNLNTLFRNRLTALFGSQSLPAGQSVCVTVGPVSFDENQLCCVQKVWSDTFTACGFATGTGICLPASGGENVNTGNCSADVTICSPPCIQLTKEVSCSPNTGFGPSVTALRGSTVYFKLTVKNCGGDNLQNVTITDTLSDANHALLACTGCTNTASCIPGTISVGNLAVGETKTFVCTFPTNPAFSVKGVSPDATNTASAVGTSVRTSEAVSSSQASATVNVLVPSITCGKLIDNDSNFASDPNDNTPPTCDLSLEQLPIGVKQAWYQLCVENTGEVKVDFTAGAGQCPDFTDSFLETVDAQIPGTGANIDTAFRNALTTAFGGQFLPTGQKVCIVIGPVSFDENVLCPTRRVLTDQFSACGIAKDTGICLPPSGGENVSTGVCECKVRICPVNICIEKGVSCSPTGPFLPAVTALRGSTVYFRVAVTNCGGEILKDVALSDSMTKVDNAFLACTGCAGLAPGTCIPGNFNLGTLNPNETKTLICTFPTNPNFSVVGNNLDAVNTANVTAVGASSGTNVSAGPVTATVDVVVPTISCELLMDDDSNLDLDPADKTPPCNSLNLAINGPPQVEHVWCRLKVCNTGEVDCNFAAGANSKCPSFSDKFLETLDSEIPGTGLDVAGMFRSALHTLYGGEVLPAGACVSIITPNPLVFDENDLCPNRPYFINRFSACGIATENGICLPPGGGENVNTGTCQGTITICQPVLFQAYPGDSNGTNIHYGGYPGNGGETISAAPGVFQLVPGDNWRNFVSAVNAGVPYTLKNVTLQKITPQFIQCADVFPSVTISQQGTKAIRLRWPLMFEAPGTKFLLTIAYGTSIQWDDDGLEGPHVPGYFHEDKWEWKVDASMESMKLLLELFHEVPYGRDEVPLISDEVMYPLLQQKLDNIIGLVEAGKTLEASQALGDFEMEITDACISTSPSTPGPTGPGTGIANSNENPACCKILVDSEYMGFKLGLFQTTK